MATVIMHAGIPKAGSSTIQDWLARNAGMLRTHGAELVVVRSRVPPSEQNARLVVEPFESGGVSSGAFVTAYIGFDRDRGVLDRVFEQLHTFADRHPLVVLSCEGFAQLFSAKGGDRAFLAKLDELACAHSVRVAYYVRAQHTCLEAAWRQWGFRLSESPSAYLAERAERLHYHQTKTLVGELAPHVSFELRPFRRDLLVGGSPAVDFARYFLGSAELARDEGDRRVNVGLPLELVNALRLGPPELVGRGASDNRALRRLQAVLGNVAVPETARIRRSRLVLQAYCHEVFEDENRALIDSEGWPTGEFVPAAVLTDWHLTELDHLWRPEASAGELALLYRALIAAIS